MVQEKMRHLIACYGATVAIILEQLIAIPRSSVVEAPAPQVRIRDSFESRHEWHPDELVTGANGRQWVLVWEDVSSGSVHSAGQGFLSN